MVKGVVYIVDDDKGVRDSLKWLLDSVGIASICFSSADEFIQASDDLVSGCMVLDIRMPNKSGLDLQTVLIDKNIRLPIIFVTAHADVPIAIQAMKKGAFDFIEKPYSEQLLLESIQSALVADMEHKARQDDQSKMGMKFKKLTNRELEVLYLVLEGKQNKEIARYLDLSIKTVETHRSNIFKKLDVSSTPELFRLAATIDLI